MQHHTHTLSDGERKNSPRSTNDLLRATLEYQVIKGAVQGSKHSKKASTQQNMHTQISGTRGNPCRYYVQKSGQLLTRYDLNTTRTNLATGEVAAARRFQRPLQVGQPTVNVRGNRKIAHDSIRGRGEQAKQHSASCAGVALLLLPFSQHVNTGELSQRGNLMNEIMYTLSCLSY